MKIFKKGEEKLARYIHKIESVYQRKLYKTILVLVTKLMDQGDDLPTATAKKNTFLSEFASETWVYSLGSEQPLKDAILNSSLPFLDQALKDFLITKL